MMNGSPFQIRSGPRLVARLVVILGLLGACSAQGQSPSLAVAGPSSFGGVADNDGAYRLSLGDYLAGSYALNVGELDQAGIFLERALAADPTTRSCCVRSICWRSQTVATTTPSSWPSGWSRSILPTRRHSCCLLWTRRAPDGSTRPARR
jgi:hypothetical protein